MTTANECVNLLNDRGFKACFHEAGEIGGVGSAEMLKREAAEGSESADLLARPPSTSAGMLAMTLFSSLLDLI